MVDYIALAVATTLSFQAIAYGVKTFAFVFGANKEITRCPETYSNLALLPTPLDDILLGRHMSAKHSLEADLTD